MTVGTHRSEFVYDGLQRRVRQVEKDNGFVQTDTRVVWCETAICEERAADGVTVTRRAFGPGEEVAGQARYFTTDHLGSVGEVTDTAGALLARYAFDPWGRRSVTAGTDVTTVGFTGHRTHTGSGLALALYRGYDAGLGRWMSQDPSGLVDGPNLFEYSRNTPTTRLDVLGDESCDCWVMVRCRPVNHPVARLAGAAHCYLVVKDQRGTTTLTAGPSNGKLHVWAVEGDGAGEGNSTMDQVTAQWERVPCDRVDCLRRTAGAMNNSGTGYSILLGKTCNYYVRNAITACGV